MLIENVGPIKKLNIELHPLTILMGDNGTGKTIVEYVMYSFYKWLFSNDQTSYKPNILKQDDAIKMIQDGHVEFPIHQMRESLIDDIVKKFNSLPRDFFDEFFKNKTTLRDDYRIEISNVDVERLILKESQGWYITHHDEKKGHRITISYVDADYRFNYGIINDASIEEIREDEVGDSNESILKDSKILNQFTYYMNVILLRTTLYRKYVQYIPAERIGINVFRKDLTLRRANQSFFAENEVNGPRETVVYPKPIADYFIFINDNVGDLNDHVVTNIHHSLLNSLIPGSYNYDKDADNIVFNTKGTSVDFNMLSSSLKSLLGIDLLFGDENVTTPSIYFIDEPEMNLHPSRQLQIADAFFELVNSEQVEYVNFVMSTHSDYFIKELVNKLLEQKVNGGYDPDQYGFYLLKDGTAENIGDVTDPKNYRMPNFDEASKKVDDEFYNLLDRLEAKEE